MILAKVEHRIVKINFIYIKENIKINIEDKVKTIIFPIFL